MIAGLLAAALLAAPSPAVEIRSVSADRPPEVNAVVRVHAADGRAVAGLGAGSFSVFEDGRQVQGLAVRQSHPEEQPVAVSLLIDTSGSMKRDNALQGAVQGTKAFLATLTPDDQREVIAFGAQIVPVARFGTPFDPAALDALQPAGDTPLRDAVSRALDGLAGQAASAKAIVVLTDGKDEGSATTQEALLAKARGAKVTVHSIVLASGDPAPLQQLADATGGTVRTRVDPAELAGIYKQIAAGLRTEYRLQFEAQARSGTHRLTVVARVDGTEASADRSFFLAGRPAVPVSDESGANPLLLAVVVVAALLALGAFGFLLRRGRRTPAGVVASPVAPVPMPTDGNQLQLVVGGACFPLVGSGIVVGRDPRAHIVIDDPTVSRSHIRLDVHGEEVWVEDLGSANGTLVNGAPVTRRRLQPGDVLLIGDQQLELRGAPG